MDGSAELFSGARHRGVFFPATARSIVLGCIVEVEFLPNQLRQFARSHGLARDELLLDERQHLALKLMGTAWTALLRYQSGDAGFVEVGLGLVVGRPRHAVLLGGVGHGRVLDRDAAQHLVLDLHEVARIEEFVLLELRIAHLLGAGFNVPSSRRALTFGALLLLFAGIDRHVTYTKLCRLCGRLVK